VYLVYFIAVIVIYFGNLHTEYFTRTPFEIEIEVPDVAKQFGLQMNNYTLFWYDATEYRQFLPLLRGKYREMNA
jgi:hypothetical protein